MIILFNSRFPVPSFEIANVAALSRLVFFSLSRSAYLYLLHIIPIAVLVIYRIISSYRVRGLCLPLAGAMKPFSRIGGTELQFSASRCSDRADVAPALALQARQCLQLFKTRKPDRGQSSSEDSKCHRTR